MEDLVGKKTDRDIINSNGVTIVPAHTVLNDDAIRLIINHGIECESIIVSSEHLAAAVPSELVQMTVSKSKQLFNSIGSSGEVPVDVFQRELIPTIEEMSRHNNIFELFEVVKAKDDYTYQHNIGVGILSTMIGRWMNLSETELSVLSLAATLHDVGKVEVPIEVLNKPGKLTDDEYAVVKKHTIHGYNILKGIDGLDPRVAQVALEHHEREDGRGYPLGLKGAEMNMFSSIVAVADVFHAMSSKRPYHEPIPFHEIVSQMERGRFGELNPEIVSLFIENVMKKTVGEQVVLTDGRIGTVVLLNPHRLDTPLVQVEQDFLDLSQLQGLRIKQIVSLAI